MVIVYSCDERFSGIFATSVLSLFENNKEIEEIIVYLIEDKVSEESKDRFQQIAEEYGRKIITLPMPDFSALAGVDITIPDYSRMAMCGRLFIASLLPQDIDKVIYVDSDTIIVRSFSELWEMDISEYFVGMSNGAMSAGYRSLLGLSPNGIYYNSGILLINLKRWREDNVEQLFIKYMNSRAGYVPFVDEGVLNAVLDGKIKLLPLRYNALSLIYAFTYKELLQIKRPKIFYSREETEAARTAPVIVHFTHNFYMPIRPWIQGCTHPYAQKYLEYRNKTPWKEETLWADNRSFLNRIYSKYSHVAPKPLMVFTSRIINAYLTPMLHKYRGWKCVHRNKRRRQQQRKRG